jgi:hypothetical protein
VCRRARWAQAFAVRLATLLGAADKSARVAEILREESRAPFHELVRHGDVAIRDLHLGNFVPGAAVFRLARGIGVDVVAQFVFLAALEVEHRRILQRFEPALQSLVGILDAE